MWAYSNFDSHRVMQQAVWSTPKKKWLWNFCFFGNWFTMRKEMKTISTRQKNNNNNNMIVRSLKIRLLAKAENEKKKLLEMLFVVCSPSTWLDSKIMIKSKKNLLLFQIYSINNVILMKYIFWPNFPTSHRVLNEKRREKYNIFSAHRRKRHEHFICLLISKENEKIIIFNIQFYQICALYLLKLFSAKLHTKQH